MINIDRDYVLTKEDLSRILMEFTTSNHRLHRLNNYYNGFHDIRFKTMEDETKPNNRLTYNFASYISDNFASYMVGNQIKYQSDNKELVDKIVAVSDYNDSGSTDIQIATDMNTFGIAYEIVYVDEDGETRFQNVSPLDMLVIHDNTIENNIVYGIRVIKLEDINKQVSYNIEVFSKDTIDTYRCGANFGEITLLDSKPHYFGQVPVVEYHNGNNDRGSFEDVISLIDAYAKMSSSECDDYEAFCDAYMVLYGASADEEDLRKMKENRVLQLDSEARAEYLIKNINRDQINSLKSSISSNIHKLAACPDFTDEAFGTSSGIALQYKLLSFTNKGTIKIRNMKKGMQKRVELICTILSKTDGEMSYTDIDIVFAPNLPIDQLNISNMITQLRGIVSNETLIGLLPFIEDVETELNKVARQPKEEITKVNQSNPEKVQPVNPNGIQNSERTGNAGVSM